MTIKQTSFCTFELDFKNGTVLLNPVKKSQSDIIVYSSKNSSYLNFDSSTLLEVRNAGEFEIKDIFINGRKNSNEESFAYTISADDLNIGLVSFCEDINNLPAELFESTDILLIAAGSGPFVSPEKAYAFVNRVAPGIAVYFGFAEQANKDLANTLDTIDELRKVIPAVQPAEKSLKIDRDYIESLENTSSLYFTN